MTPAAIALEAYRSRHAFAQRKLAEHRRAQAAGGGGADKGWSEAEAEQKLLPWAALAIRAGADPGAIHLQLVARLSDYRAGGLSESVARACVADDLCPRAEALAVLAEARNRALAVADGIPPSPAGRGAGGEGEQWAQNEARALATLATHLGAEPYPYRAAERKAA